VRTAKQKTWVSNTLAQTLLPANPHRVGLYLGTTIDTVTTYKFAEQPATVGDGVMVPTTTMLLHLTLEEYGETIRESLHMMNTGNGNTAVVVEIIEAP
jgi:hypothetical protein